MSAPCPPMSGALCAAAESGDLVDVARLLDAGADINALERQITPLFAALRNVTPSGAATVKLLVSRGADCSTCVPDTLATPLMEACLRGHESGARALLRGGANAHSLDAEGRSALHWAAMGGCAALLGAMEGLMTARGGDAPATGTPRDALDQSGYTPLMYAAEHGHLDCVRVLLAAGADTQPRNPSGQRVTELAEWYGHKEVRALLEAAAVGPSEARADAPLVSAVPASELGDAGTPTGHGNVAAAMEGLSL